MRAGMLRPAGRLAARSPVATSLSPGRKDRVLLNFSFKIAEFRWAFAPCICVFQLSYFVSAVFFKRSKFWVSWTSTAPQGNHHSCSTHRVNCRAPAFPLYPDMPRATAKDTPISCHSVQVRPSSGAWSAIVLYTVLNARLK